MCIDVLDKNTIAGKNETFPSCDEAATQTPYLAALCFQRTVNVLASAVTVMINAF